MQQSQNMNEKELFKLLNELRILKRNGDLDIDEKLEQQVFKWRNILDYCILEAAVKHYSEEVISLYSKQCIYLIIQRNPF